MKVKDASIRELVHWIMNECPTESHAAHVFEAWLVYNGYKKEETCYIDENQECSNCHTKTPERMDITNKFCPVCGAKFSLQARGK